MTTQSEGKEALTVVVRRQAGAAVLDLYGELDGLGDEALGIAFDEAANIEPERILLNFAGVDYINSIGIVLLVGLLSQARKQALPLCACGLNEHYVELFRITRLADFMPVFDSEEAAVQAAV